VGVRVIAENLVGDPVDFVIEKAPEHPHGLRARKLGQRLEIPQRAALDLLVSSSLPKFAVAPDLAAIEFSMAGDRNERLLELAMDRFTVFNDINLALAGFENPIAELRNAVLFRNRSGIRSDLPPLLQSGADPLRFFGRGLISKSRAVCEYREPN
jgi:hypothetical protein